MYFFVVDHRFQQPIVKITCLQQLHLSIEFFADLGELLVLAGFAVEQEKAVIVGRPRNGGAALPYLLLLEQIYIDESSAAVVQNTSRQFRDQRIFGLSSSQFPTHLNPGFFLALNGNFNGLIDFGRLGNFPFGHPFVLFVAPILDNFFNHHLRIKIARENDGHVIGHVVGAEKFMDFLHGGIFQMLPCSQRRLGTIRVVGQQGLGHGLPHFSAVAGLGTVVLFIHRF